MLLLDLDVYGGWIWERYKAVHYIQDDIIRYHLVSQ